MSQVAAPNLQGWVHWIAAVHLQHIDLVFLSENICIGAMCSCLDEKPAVGESDLADFLRAVHQFGVLCKKCNSAFLSNRHEKSAINQRTWPC